MVSGGCVGDDAGSSVLTQSEFMEEMIREAKQERVAVIQTGGDSMAVECSVREGRRRRILRR